MIKLAVIGDPIEHSLSPTVHTAALAAMGIDCRYEKVRVKKGGLEDFLKYALGNGINGFNLTMPHKVDILPYLTYIAPEAERFESVNTVKVKDGKLYGYNTDAEGYCAALKNAGHDFADSRIVIMGAGGVVRTLALKAALEGAQSIAILNRTAEKAEEIAKSVRDKTSANIISGKLCAEYLNKLCADCDILVNATPLGMSGTNEDFSDFSFLNALPKESLVSDLIYNPSETTLLKNAAKLGLDILNGLGMLVYQALLADKIYTGADFDMDKIYRITAQKTEDILRIQ